MRNVISLRLLEKMSPDKKLLIVNFFITNPKGLKKIESHWAKRDPNHRKFLGRCKKDTEAIKVEELGGSATLVDPDNFRLGFLGEIEIPVATGAFYHPAENALLVGSYSCIKKVAGGKIVGSLSNRLFNDIHTLTSSLSGSLLIVSTGIDAILEINPKNARKIIWEWMATEHGYDTNPIGQKRKIDKKKDYRNVNSATPEHTTHINSCLEIQSGKILATLFHQGQLIEINKRSGKVKVVLSGLKSPHHIRYWANGFIISDTRNGRVLLLDKSYKVIREINGNYNWVQDAIPLTDGSIIIGDSNNNRLVKVDVMGKKLDEFRWGKKERKIGSFLAITAGEAMKIFTQE